MLAFGPPNAPPRYPIGYVPPEDRKTIRVRRMEPGPYGEVEHRKSVSLSELDAATRASFPPSALRIGLRLAGEKKGREPEGP